MEYNTIIDTQSLSKRYGSGVLAVDSVAMSVRRGEVYGFLGPNGAGKTTTAVLWRAVNAMQRRRACVWRLFPATMSRVGRS